MTQEAKFVLWFNGFTGDGLGVSLTVRADEFEELRASLAQVERAYPQLGGFNTILKDMPEGQVKPKEYHIIGWARGFTKDARGGRNLPCVYLYCDLIQLDMKVCSVYHEDLWKLPQSVNWKEARDMGDQAMLISRGAKQSAAWNDCDFHIVLMPVFDYEGNVVMSVKGNKPKMRFSNVIGYDPEPPAAQVSAQGDGEPERPQRQPQAQAQAQAEPVRKGRINDGDGPCPVCHAPAGKVHAPKCSLDAGEAPKPATKAQAATPAPVGDATINRYTTALHDPNIAISPNVLALAMSVRRANKSSASYMSITADGKKGQHNFLCGLIDGIVGEEMHGAILAILAGRDVSQKNPLGSDCRFLLDGIWPGKPDNPNDKYDPTMVATIKSMSVVVAQIEGAKEFDPETDIPF